MKMKRMMPNKSAGFTLVEMAMVLAIISLLLVGLLPTITGQIEQQRVEQTRKQLEDIRQALIGFAVINGRLPCPAQASIATGTAHAGEEAISGNYCSCTSTSSTIAQFSPTNNCSQSSITGVLPWATLGLPETDAWNNRFTYRVSSVYADMIAANTYGTGCTPGTNLTTSSFAICSPGTPDIFDAASGNLVYENVPAVVVSHGSNGLGAYMNTGIQIPGASGDEAENSDNNLSFVSHEFSTNYDDLLTWISPSALINRMVSAGKLP